MNERLLTDTERDEAPDIWPESKSHVEARLLAQDASTRTTTLREVGKWLDAINEQPPPQWSTGRWLIGNAVIAALKRGEAPWEGK